MNPRLWTLEEFAKKRSLCAIMLDDCGLYHMHRLAVRLELGDAYPELLAQAALLQEALLDACIALRLTQAGTIKGYEAEALDFIERAAQRLAASSSRTASE